MKIVTPAVTPNVMTIAVSASACGNGSLNDSFLPRPISGGMPPVPPDVINKMFVPCPISPTCMRLSRLPGPASPSRAGR